MGQKTSPVGLRLQINRTWDSRWFAEGQDYGRLLLEDLKIRRYILDKLPQAAISKVVIERPAKICRVSIYAVRPGVIIGKKGSDIEKLKFRAKEVADELRPRLEEVRSQIAKLGDAPAEGAPPEAPEVAAERSRLNALAARSTAPSRSLRSSRCVPSSSSAASSTSARASSRAFS